MGFHPWRKADSGRWAAGLVLLGPEGWVGRRARTGRPGGRNRPTAGLPLRYSPGPWRVPMGNDFDACRSNAKFRCLAGLTVGIRMLQVQEYLR